MFDSIIFLFVWDDVSIETNYSIFLLLVHVYIYM